MITVSYIVGICVDHDAISDAVVREIEWLENTGRYNVRLFTYACRPGVEKVSIVSNTQQVVLHPHFQTSDILIYHFGVYSGLFDSIFFAPKQARKLCVFHNVTPAEHLPEDSQELITKSFNQMGHMRQADLVICVSGVNIEVLRESGYSGDAVTVPLPVSSELCPPSQKPSQKDGIIRIAFVGRLVQSKGIDELLHVISHLAVEHSKTSIEFTMIGNESFSSPDLIAKARQMKKEVDSKPSNLTFTLALNASNETKNEVFSKADIFCLPSYHEGYCVPVLEALSAGCQVVTYDNSNLKYIGGNLSHLVPTGDRDALYETLNTLLNAIQGGTTLNASLAYEDYIRRAHDYVSSFSHNRVRRSFLQHVDG